MSQPREKVFFLFAANLVVTVVVVAAAVTFFTPEPEVATPDAQDGLVARLDDLSGRFEGLGEEVASVREENASLRTRVAAAEAEVARLKEFRAAAATAAGGPGAAGAEPAEPTESEKLASSIASMMKQQIARQRQRFIQDIVDPDEESIARQERQVRRMAEQASRNIGLDERDAAEVERILTEVDRRRREKLRQLFTSKASPDDVTYPEVKQVLDESFEEEDRMIGNSLAADKAEQYQETAEPVRNFIYVAASTAFPSGEEDGR